MSFGYFCPLAVEDQHCMRYAAKPPTATTSPWSDASSSGAQIPRFKQAVYHSGRLQHEIPRGNRHVMQDVGIQMLELTE